MQILDFVARLPIKYKPKSNCLNCLKKSTIFFKNLLHLGKFFCILGFAVALIAMKREVATVKVGFPWSECQVRKLTTSHCTNNNVYFR